MTRRLVLASSHFAPSNLVGGHRARLLSRYLPEFGWEPIVVTGDPRHYQERPDPDLLRLVAPGLEVVQGALVKGNVKQLRIVVTMRSVDPSRTVLTCDLLMTPEFMAPQAAIDEELRDAAQNAVDGVKDKAERSSGH